MSGLGTARRLTTGPRRAWPTRGDGVAICLLAVIVAAGWISGTGLQRWSLPLASPVDGVRGDSLFHMALVKAAMEGDFVPWRWKTVSALGAPDGANWNDWPIVEEATTLWMALAGRLVGLAAGYNLCLAAGSVLAALTSFGVARAFGCSTIASFVGGLAFGLAPFTFAQTPHHPFIAQAWHVPLFLPVWRWVATGAGLTWRSPRFWFATAVGVITGLQSPYYTYILCQLTLVGAVLTYARTRERGPLLSALAVIGAAAAAFALMNLDTWTYRLAHGPNSGALVREYKWLEIYGLKLVDLVVPPVAHRAAPFATFAASHRAAAPLQDEGSYLGLVGIAALLLLIGTAVVALVRGRADEVPVEAWWVLWIVLTFATGGLNTILGAFGFTLFRTGCRYSVVILAVALFHGARRFTAWERGIETQTDGGGASRGGASLAALTAAAGLTALILYDQVPRPPTPEESAGIARQVEADRAFVREMEAALPAGALVFQVPVMEFPESPAAGLASYDHFRPYLHANGLRFSFGTNKGREADRWQQELQRLLFAGAVPNQQAQRIDFQVASVRAVIAALRERGFAALYLNRNGFPDQGKGLEKGLRDAGLAAAIESPARDLVCIPLGPP
jgi:phosphoglycerol transferase